MGQDNEHGHYENHTGLSYTLEEIAKHNKKEDIWVTVNGLVLNVTEFIKEHPGGDMVILAFAGRDASAEFNCIHPPHVIQHHAADRVIGDLAAYEGIRGALQSVRPHGKDKPAPKIDMPGWQAWVWALYHMAYTMIYAIAATIFSTNAITINKGRDGLTKSAMFMIFFLFIHALGNMHVFKGPDDFCGYGYMFVRMYFPHTDFNFVELYLLLALLTHIAVGLKRAWGKRNCAMLQSGQLNLAISGLCVLTFLLTHLTQFRFGDTDQFGPYWVRPPPLLMNFAGLLHADLFWDYDKSVAPVATRNIYLLEYQVFGKWYNAVGYIAAAIVFMIHGMLGWKNVMPVLKYPKMFQTRVLYLGWLLIIGIAVVYISFPVYIMMTDPYEGENCDINNCTTSA